MVGADFSNVQKSINYHLRFSTFTRYYRMVLEQVLAQLRAELRRVQEAIVVLERLANNLQRPGAKRVGQSKAQKLDPTERVRAAKAGALEDI